MSVVTWIAVPIIIGWLATLIMHPDVYKVSWWDFAIGVAGAGIAAAVLDRFFALPLTGPYGISSWSLLGCSCGATALLAAANVPRYRRLRSEPPRPRTCFRQTLLGWQPETPELPDPGRLARRARLPPAPAAYIAPTTFMKMPWLLKLRSVRSSEKLVKL